LDQGPGGQVAGELGGGLGKDRGLGRFGGTGWQRPSQPPAVPREAALLRVFGKGRQGPLGPQDEVRQPGLERMGWQLLEGLFEEPLGGGLGLARRGQFGALGEDLKPAQLGPVAHLPRRGRDPDLHGQAEGPLALQPSEAHGVREAGKGPGALGRQITRAPLLEGKGIGGGPDGAAHPRGFLLRRLQLLRPEDGPGGNLLPGGHSLVRLDDEDGGFARGPGSPALERLCGEVHPPGEGEGSFRGPAGGLEHFLPDVLALAR